MKKLMTVAILGIVSVLVVASFASASHATKPTTETFAAVLNIGQEVPHPTGTKVGAAGKFTATVSGTTLTWKLTFGHLSGSATTSHIHTGAKGKSGPVLIPLCGPCTSPASGTATVTSAQVTDMAAGKDYVNVHTAKNPNGEIRGQIKKSM
jgi:CHRD domain